MADAWQHEESFAVTNAHMLDADVLCDVTFLAGEEKQEVKCHRFMLASRSPVFYTMFCGSLPEASVVEIPDVEADILRTIVRFMYTREIQLMPYTVMAVMYAAKKYDIKLLTNCCKTFLEKEIAVDNVCMILDQALKYDETDLIQLCLSFVSENTNCVLQNDGFLSMSQEALKLILEKEKDSPNLPPEEIYASSKRWAKKQACSGKDVSDQALRQKLGDLIFLFDFERMTFESFMDTVGQDDILSDKEKFKFLADIRQRQKKKTMTFVVEIFSEVDYYDSEKTQNVCPYSEGFTQISFKSSRDVILCCVSLLLPFEDSLTGLLEILKDGTVVLAQNVNLNPQCDRMYENVQLDRKIDIRKGVIYSVRYRLSGYIICMFEGRTLKDKQSINDVEIEFMELTASNTETYMDFEMCQVHDLTFED